MSYAVMPMADYKAACDKVREKTNTAEVIKSGDMAEKVEEVYKAGQLSVMASSDALKGSASGEVVSIKDVSPVEHNVNVTLSSDTLTDFRGVKVTVGGKNFFNPNLTKGTIENPTAQRVLEFGKYYPGFHYNDLYAPNNIEYFDYDGNTFSFKTRVAYCGAGVPIKVKPNTTFRARADMTSNGRLYCAFYTKEGVYISNNTGATVRPVTTPENCEMLLLVPLSNDSEPCTISNIQLEVGEEVTDFEPYVEPTEYTSNADGTVEGIKSKYPSMSFTTDTEGVNISANYYKDIDKVFENLAINTALSGGE